MSLSGKIKIGLQKPLLEDKSLPGQTSENTMDIFLELKNFLESTSPQGPRPLVAILGATASGKTALSLKIAKMFDGEIISADSRQLYKYMDIGTDKIPENKREGIPHHLIDILEPNEEFTLADFKRLTLKTIDDIYLRNKLPIIVGGTGLYFNTLLQNYQIPSVPPNQKLRQELDQIFQEKGAAALHKMLEERDPEAAARIHQNNVRYVIRALEINIAGQSQKIDAKGEPLFEPFIIGIAWPRELLYERIHRRVDEQIDCGLINEVKTLLQKGYNPKLPSMSSLGYAQIIAYLEGDCTLEEAKERIKKEIRNYAKRQITWFRHYQGIHWIDGREGY
jgi:tRNA dimethylallyltransferase